MRRFVYLLVFLMLADDGAATNVYARYMFAPFKWVHAVLFEPIASVRPFDVILALVLLFNASKKKSPPVRPMKKALLTAVGIIVWGFLYGLGRGGSFRNAAWQVYLLLALILASFAFASVLTTADDFIGLIKTVVAAGLYHAVMGLTFYFVYVRGQLTLNQVGDYLTTHDDTVLWTVSVGFIVLAVLQTPNKNTRLAAYLGLPILLLAIQFNHRRLAWISLMGAMAALYFLVPPSAAKRKIRRAVFVIVPLFLVYAIIGWGRPESIFAPLHAFESVSTAQDASTLARNAENLGLVTTAANEGWIFGAGWGNPYHEVTSKYQIYFFELWPYIPHNSVLGLLCYSGYVGFVGYWLTIPTAAFLHARTARYGTTQHDRFIGIVGVMQLVACTNQWFGDMGSFSTLTDYTLATCFAAALRVPASSGAWSDRAAPAQRAAPPNPSPSQGA